MNTLVGRQYYIYILASRSGTLYTGVTNDLRRRVYQHKNKLVEGFTKKYNVTRLVHYEVYGDVRDAIKREKQIKGWVRRKKIALIESTNPKWQDLSEEWDSLRGGGSLGWGCGEAGWKGSFAALRMTGEGLLFYGMVARPVGCGASEQRFTVHCLLLSVVCYLLSVPRYLCAACHSCSGSSAAS